MKIKSYTTKQLPESKPVTASGSLERVVRLLSDDCGVQARKTERQGVLDETDRMATGGRTVARSTFETNSAAIGKQPNK